MAKNITSNRIDISEFTETERYLIKQIEDEALNSSILLIKEAVGLIWSNDTPRIIELYPDHGLRHIRRVIDFAGNILKVNEGEPLSQIEIYSLLACCYLHDIGMQCDIITFDEIKITAEQLGARFNAEFQRSSNSYSYQQQNEIRRNHTFLSAAWIINAFYTGNTILGKAAKSIPSNLVKDLADICLYHTRLMIAESPTYFYHSNDRKTLIAAILRFSDELDIGMERASNNAAKNLDMPPQISTHYWIMSLTKIKFISNNIINISIYLHPLDAIEVRNIIYERIIKGFIKKNKEVINVLRQYGIQIAISSDSDIIEDIHAERLPADIVNFIRSWTTPIISNSEDILSSEKVPTCKDSPLKNTEDDLLGRVAFAEYICSLMTNSVHCHICNGNGCKSCNDTGLSKPESNRILIYGPWGAGKSSLLNFLSSILEQDDYWLVVEFNAWRNQHIKPPWWSLMDSVFQKARKTKSMSKIDVMREWLWRLYTGRQQIIYSIILLFIFFIIIYIIIDFILLPLAVSYLDKLTPSNPTGVTQSIINNADSLFKISAAFITAFVPLIAAAIWFLSKSSLLIGSNQAAQKYTEMTNDPMNEIKIHFEWLIGKIKSKHVAVLIDDLDRCQCSYVVGLLEGIQTLFYQAPIVFVVMADRHWLNACYEQEYNSLNAKVKELGKSLGFLFLEKIFQFSIPTPGITKELKERYLSYLLRIRAFEIEDDIKRAREQAKELVSKAESEEKVKLLVDTAKGKSFIEQRAVREEAAIRLAAPNIKNLLQHSLLSYSKFLGPNPRSIKLLVNAYSANRVLAFLSEVEIDRHQLVLWTIISLRWPMLADYLEDYPNKLVDIGKQNAADVPKELGALFSNMEIASIINGPPPLEVETIQKCTQLHA